MKDEYIDAHQEFDRQVQTLLEKDYPTLAGMTEPDFLALIEPLKDKIDDSFMNERGIPFVIVIKCDVIPALKMMEQVDLRGMAGTVDMNPLEPKQFKPIENLGIPKAKAYLLIGIDTGKELLNITPDEALRRIRREKRTPLTIDEGIAVVTQFPETLRNKREFCCFSLLGSRRDDERVPALWVSKRNPRLGWCWNKNPHTWLGSASCSERIGA